MLAAAHRKSIDDEFVTEVAGAANRTGADNPAQSAGDQRFRGRGYARHDPQERRATDRISPILMRLYLRRTDDGSARVSDAKRP